MKKAIMKRAWEIYRTLEGDRAAKMSMALREAWAEAKADLEFVRKANAARWSAPDDLEAITARRIMYRIADRQRDAERGKKAQALYAEFEGMTEYEADEYVTRKRNDLKDEARRIQWDDEELAKELRELARLYLRAYCDLYNVQTRPRTIGVYDTTGANFGQIAI